MNGVAVAEEGIYVPSSSGNALLKVDAANGRVLASISVPHVPPGAFLSPPAMVDDKLVVSETAFDSLVAFERSTGGVAWRAGGDPGGGDRQMASLGTVAVGQGILYFQTFSSGELVAVDAATGVQRWRARPAGLVGSRPAAGESMVYASTESVLVAFNSNGEEQWRFAPVPVDSLNVSPSHHEGTVFVSGEEAAYAVDAETGQELWRSEFVRWALHPPILTAERAYYVVDDRRTLQRDVVALNRLDGLEEWRIHLSRKAPSGQPPVIVGDVLYVVTENIMAAIEIASGEQLRTAVLDDTSSALLASAGRSLVVQTDDGLYWLDPST
jgi:outer membrane protein assembly factor BamB